MATTTSFFIQDREACNHNTDENRGLWINKNTKREKRIIIIHVMVITILLNFFDFS